MRYIGLHIRVAFQLAVNEQLANWFTAAMCHIHKCTSTLYSLASKRAYILLIGLYYVFRTKCSKWASIFSQLPIINTRFLYGWRPRKTLLLYVKLTCGTKKTTSHRSKWSPAIDLLMIGSEFMIPVNRYIRPITVTSRTQGRQPSSPRMRSCSAFYPIQAKHAALS
jgi:hypothetical protein